MKPYNNRAWIMVLPVFLMTDAKVSLPGASGTPTETTIGLGTLGALPVGLLVFGIGLSLGGTTGYAINPARDLGPRRGDGGREFHVHRFQIALDHPRDRGEGESLPLERADAPDALDVLLPVERDAALALRRGEEAARLVVADRVHGHVAGCRELLDPVPHEEELYEFPLTRSALRGLPRRPVADGFAPVRGFAHR